MLHIEERIIKWIYLTFLSFLHWLHFFFFQNLLDLLVFKQRFWKNVPVNRHLISLKSITRSAYVNIRCEFGSIVSFYCGHILHYLFIFLPLSKVLGVEVIYFFTISVVFFLIFWIVLKLWHHPHLFSHLHSTSI